MTSPNSTSGQSAPRLVATEQKSERMKTIDAMVEEIIAMLDDSWPPRIYRERILPLRTRSHFLPAVTDRTRIEVQHTLLGVELRMGRWRIACPDMATARYLATFARSGCTGVAIPYDITRVSRVADELESAWHRMLLLIEHLAGERKPAFRSRVRARLTDRLRREIEEAGAGTKIPLFNQNTKQRRRR